MKYFPKECILTIKELRKICEEWKIILGLENWDIKVEICRQNALLSDSTGTCNAVSSMRTATIKMISPIDWDAKPFVYNMETVLVHELLHCHFNVLNECFKKPLINTIFEQNIELLANVLVGLRREIK